MPRISTGLHTAGSLRLTAENLKQIAAQLDAAALLMETIPEVREVTMNYEQGRTDGLAWLQQWADGARNAVRDAKLAQVRAVSVADDSVSAGNHKTPKPKRK